MFLGSLLLFSLTELYLHTKKQTTNIQNQFNQTIDLTLISELLRKSIKNAGFTPCGNINKLTTHDYRNSKKLADIIITTTGKNHNLQINSLDSSFTKVLAYIDKYNILVALPSDYSKNNYKSNYLLNKNILLANCHYGEVQQIKAINATVQGLILTMQQPLHFQYNTSSTYWGLWREEKFFIKNKKNLKSALFYKTNHTEELTEMITGLTANYRGKSKIVEINLAVNNKEHSNFQLVTKIRAK